MLNKGCATGDETSVNAGLIILNEFVDDHLIHRDGGNKIQSRIKNVGERKIIDKVWVGLGLPAKTNIIEFTNFAYVYVHFPVQYGI